MHQEAYLTEFVEVLPGKPKRNEELPYFGSENAILNGQGAGVETRQMLDKEDSLEKITQKALDDLFAILNISGENCSGLVLATCDDIDHDDLKEMTKAIAHKNRIHGIIKEVHYACSGFIRALEMAREIYDKHPDGHVAIVTADTANFVDWSQSGIASVFGAGGSATTLASEGNLHLLQQKSHVQIDPRDSIFLKHSDESVDHLGNFCTNRKVMHMSGGKLMRVVPGMMVDDIEASFESINRPMSDCAGIIPHRASLPLLDKVRGVLQSRGTEIEVYDYLTHGGNTGASTIPMTLSRMLKDADIKMKGLYSLVAAGAGPYFQRGQLTHGSAIVEVE